MTPPKGCGVTALPNFGVPFSLCIHPLTQNYQISHGNIWGGSLFLGGHPRPTSWGGVPALSSFEGSFLFMRTPFVAAKFDVVAHVGEGRVLAVNHASHPKTAEFQRSPDWGLLYFCLHPLTQNDHIRHSNIWRVTVLGQPRHCICKTALRGLSALAGFVSSISCLESPA